MRSYVGGETLPYFRPILQLTTQLEEEPPKEKVSSQASVVGKTWKENHLGRMHHGTIRAPGGKPSEKPNINLRLLHGHLGFPAPFPLEDLGWGRGGLQGEGSVGALVGEGKGGWALDGWAHPGCVLWSWTVASLKDEYWRARVSNQPGSVPPCYIK